MTDEQIGGKRSGPISSRTDGEAMTMEVKQMKAVDLVRLGGERWRVTWEGRDDRVFDDWEEAYTYFSGEREVLAERTLQADDGSRDV